MRILLYCLLALVIVVGLNFAFGWVDVGYTKTVGKAKENARRTVYEETQSYVEGKVQELTKARLEYMESKDSVEKRAIKMTVVQSFANFDDKKLPIDLRDFLDQMKNP